MIKGFYWQMTGLNFRELLPKQKILLETFLLSKEIRRKTVTVMWHDSLAGNLNLVSMILLCLATFHAKKLYEFWPWALM